LAFADDGSPSTSWLQPLPPAQQLQYPDARAQLKGSSDLSNAIDSPEAGALRLKFSTLSSDQINELSNLYKALDPVSIYCCSVPGSGDACLKFLEDSFALGHRARAILTTQNMLQNAQDI